MSNMLGDIVILKEGSNPTMDNADAPYAIEFYKNMDFLGPWENYTRFIKKCEYLVRTSPYYKRYVAYIKGTVGLNKCQVLSNIEEEDAGDSKADHLIDMHHGPMLTLFDYCSVVTDYLLYHNLKCNTFIVADLVIKAHYENMVQVIMVSETVHDAIHSPNGPFINMNQGFGDVYKFLKKYKDGISGDLAYKINRYYETSLKYDSFDKNLFEINQFVQHETSEFSFVQD